MCIKHDRPSVGGEEGETIGVATGNHSRATAKARVTDSRNNPMISPLSSAIEKPVIIRQFTNAVHMTNRPSPIPTPSSMNC